MNSSSISSASDRSRGLEAAIKRLEAGEDPEKIEADMGDVFGGLMGGADDEEGPSSSGAASYSHDTGLYDY